MSAPYSSWEKEVRERQSFRCQMVQSFGFTVMDHGLTMAHCPNCGYLSPVNSAFPDSDWNSLYHLVSVLETFLESQDSNITCAFCDEAIATDENFECWLWHAHYLPEVKRDLQLLVHRKAGETKWIEGMLVDADCKITPIAVPLPEADFKAESGTYFSLRQVWKDFLQEHWPITKFAGLRVSQGYYLVLNPQVDSDDDLAAFKDNCMKLVTESEPAGSQFEFADLSWADSWNFEENTYHNWLSEYETDLQESNVIAGVLASPDEFYNIIARELEIFECQVKKDDEDAPVAFLGDDEYYLSFDFREFLINAMIKGYDYWGALRYIEPVLDSWEKARAIGERLKSLLPYGCTISGGHFFQCRNAKSKKIVKEFDLMGLEETNDELEDKDEFVAWIAPQISINPLTLKFEPSG